MSRPSGKSKRILMTILSESHQMTLPVAPYSILCVTMKSDMDWPARKMVR